MRSELGSRFGSLTPAEFSTKRVDQIVVYYQGMVWNGKWNGTKILVWNMEDARME